MFGAVAQDGTEALNQPPYPLRATFPSNGQCTRHPGGYEIRKEKSPEKEG